MPRHRAPNVIKIVPLMLCEFYLNSKRETETTTERERKDKEKRREGRKAWKREIGIGMRFAQGIPRIGRAPGRGSDGYAMWGGGRGLIPQLYPLVGLEEQTRKPPHLTSTN